MSDALWTRNYDDTVTTLARWRGFKAVVWEYASGHGQLLIRFFPPDQRERRGYYLLCKDCQVLQFFGTEFANSDISLTRGEHRLGQVITITDPGRIQVICWAAFAAETEIPISLHEE
jgi:hypothetical protein